LVLLKKKKKIKLLNKCFNLSEIKESRQNYKKPCYTNL
jgi:hypothetical protein